jgi:hypothetical protein
MDPRVGESGPTSPIARRSDGFGIACDDLSGNETLSAYPRSDSKVRVTHAACCSGASAQKSKAH